MKRNLKCIGLCIVFNLLIINTVKAQIWQPLANGLAATPTAITTYEGSLAVAYTLGIKNKKRLHEIAIWNGIYWSKLPTIFSDSNSIINALLFKDSALYIAGKFLDFNEVKGGKNIVRWKNKKFQALEELSGTSTTNIESIHHLNYYDGILVIAGIFKNEVVSNSNNLSFYKNGKWTSSGLSLTGNPNGLVNTSLFLDKKLFIGGRFTKVGLLETNYIAGFGTSTSINKIKNEFVPVKMVHYDKLGVFWGEHATSKTVMPAFFAFDSDTLFELDEGLDKVNDIYDIMSDGNIIYAVGDFKLDAIDDKQNIIMFKDGKWQQMPGGVFQGVKNIAFFRQNLVVTGSFKGYRNLTAINVAQFKPNVGVVMGKIFFDKDANCVFNSRDEFLSNRTIKIEPGEHFVRPDKNGTYLVLLPEGKYTVSVLPRKYWSASPCDKLNKAVFVKNGELIDTIDFALVQDTSVRDLSVRLNAQSGGIATRKDIQLYYINYENLGSNEVNNGLVTLHFDQKLEDLVSDPKPDLVGGDSAVWNVNMLPGVAKTIKCKFKIASSAANQLNLQASIKQDSKTNDVDQSNNKSELIQKIQEEDIEINKQVFPGIIMGDTAYIDPNVKSVDYQISFSNYSQDTVRTVHVVDTIQINHSMQEMRETGASHPYSYQIIPGKPGENIAVIIWTFNNINLAPNPNKNGEIVNDDGFIAFSIGLKPDLTSGVILQNKAQVAFDYSDEKNSNAVFAMVVEPDGVENALPTARIKIYPNPTDNLLYINGENTSEKIEYAIYSVNGSIHLSGSISPQDGINVRALPAGLYIIQGMANHKTFVSRFVRL